MTSPGTVSISEAAALLGISRNLAYQEAARGQLAGVPVLHVGRRLLLPRAVLFHALGIEDAQEPESMEAPR